MRVYEVFLMKEGKEGFRHAGSLEAPDDEMAAVLARETYTRRQAPPPQRRHQGGRAPAA